MSQPAFPRSIYSLNGAIDSQSMSVGYGMDLRDYFAAKAMQGQLSILENVIALAREQIRLEDVCIVSYEVADAMMKAREL